MLRRVRQTRALHALPTAVLTALLALAIAAPASATYSIVARDPETGDIGVAVQSHYFSVGPIVPWAEPGVGAVATQSLVEVAYGPRGLELMSNGKGAKQALAELLERDPNRDVRQVAMIDARGEAAAHTGARCIPDAGDIVGNQYSVQANLMANKRVWPAMAAAYERAKGDLAERLLAALDAAQAAGGDIRGQQSAAIVIVKGKRSAKPWMDRIMDLRVDDSPRPLQELRRLVKAWRAYRNVDRGDELITEGKVEEAMQAYSEGARLAPGNDEILFWHAATLWQLGRQKEATPIFTKVFARDRRWVDLVPRLVPAGLLKDDPKEIRRIQALAPAKRKPQRLGLRSLRRSASRGAEACVGPRVGAIWARFERGPRPRGRPDPRSRIPSEDVHDGADRRLAQRRGAFQDPLRRRPGRHSRRPLQRLLHRRRGRRPRVPRLPH